jgi:hypothetical protein
MTTSAKPRHRALLVEMLAALFCLAAAMAGSAHAVVINTDTGAGNTSAPADDPGWGNVGVLGIGTGVYVGNGWVLTAGHVGGGSIVLNGGTYAMRSGSGITLTNNGAAGKTANTDLYMFQLVSPPPGLPGVTIASAMASPGDQVTMIGAGRNRGDYTEWTVTGTTWTPAPPGTGDESGYATQSSRSLRWGTNTLTTTGTWVQYPNYTSGDFFAFNTTFDGGGGYSDEAQAVAGDSGGAVFHKNGSVWELSGMILAVGGLPGQQPNPVLYAVFGDTTYAADLSFYRPQILAIVPEPALAPATAITLAGIAAIARLTGRSKKKRAASGRTPPARVH